MVRVWLYESLSGFGVAALKIKKRAAKKGKQLVGAPRQTLTEEEYDGFQRLLELWGELPQEVSHGEVGKALFSTIIQLRTTAEDARFDLMVEGAEHAISANRLAERQSVPVKGELHDLAVQAVMERIGIPTLEEQEGPG